MFSFRQSFPEIHNLNESLKNEIDILHEISLNSKDTFGPSFNRWKNTLNQNSYPKIEDISNSILSLNPILEENYILINQSIKENLKLIPLYEKNSKNLIELEKLKKEYLNYKKSTENFDLELEKLNKSNSTSNLQIEKTKGYQLTAKQKENNSKKKIEIFENQFKTEFINYQINIVKSISNSLLNTLENQKKYFNKLLEISSIINETVNNFKFIENNNSNIELKEELKYILDLINLKKLKNL